MTTTDETRRTRRRYDRQAGIYDLLEKGVERRAFRHWRAELWSQVEGTRILEVGVGTGKNIPYYPPGAQIVGIDLSPRMLERARAAAKRQTADVELHEMDVEQLDLPSGSFDAVVATFVFCSVPLPVAGLREIRRVLRPEGRLYLLEHVLSQKRGLRGTMRLVSPVAVRMMGANIDRETKRNIETAGFCVEEECDLWLDIFKLFIARPQAAHDRGTHEPSPVHVPMTGLAGYARGGEDGEAIGGEDDVAMA